MIIEAESARKPMMLKSFLWSFIEILLDSDCSLVAISGSSNSRCLTNKSHI